MRSSSSTRSSWRNSQLNCARPTSTATTCAALSPAAAGDGRIAYVLASEDADLRAACKQLNARLNGRGGGKPHMVQGSWAATRADLS